MNDDVMVKCLISIIQNDKSGSYDYDGERRPFDGKRLKKGRWCTPTEIAWAYLRDDFRLSNKVVWKLLKEREAKE